MNLHINLPTQFKYKDKHTCRPNNKYVARLDATIEIGFPAIRPEDFFYVHRNIKKVSLGLLDTFRVTPENLALRGVIATPKSHTSPFFLNTL